MNPAVASLPLPDAQAVLINAAQPVAAETIATVDALGRILAEDISAPRAFPDTPRSAVDGYAVAQPGLTRYRIVETLGAGETPQRELRHGEAAAVMTGATVPAGSSAVVRIEDTEAEGENLRLTARVEERQNMNRIGEEMNAGATILRAGTRLSPVNHSVLAATGTAAVKVYRLPRVGILITGNELLPLGTQHRPGSSYDSNRYFLAGCLQQMGLTATILGPVSDDEETISNSLEQLAATCDLVISSGGVSMGKYDFIRPLLHSSGFEVLVNRTGIKPGRPLLVARREATLFFGMPGYPAACLVNFFYYLLPTLKKLMGLEQVLPPTRRIALAEDLRGRKGRYDILRVRLEGQDGRQYARKLAGQLTSHYLNFGHCDGLVMLEAGKDYAAAGEELDMLEFRAQF